MHNGCKDLLNLFLVVRNQRNSNCSLLADWIKHIHSSSESQGTFLGRPMYPQGSSATCVGRGVPSTQSESWKLRLQTCWMKSLSLWLIYQREQVTFIFIPEPFRWQWQWDLFHLHLSINASSLTGTISFSIYMARKYKHTKHQFLMWKSQKLCSTWDCPKGQLVLLVSVPHCDICLNHSRGIQVPSTSGSV
jgi:hypothetical protein